MALTGRATPAGTQRRAAGRSGYRRLGRTDLTVSTVGFGGYRAGRRDPMHRAALQRALVGGVNLIDTSSNYMLGDSERMIGETLADSGIPRDEIVVVTKIGYVQGPNLDLAREREADGQPFSDMVHYMDGCWHCISPEFLEDQLARALDRLGLETIDVLLLHNPEYFLMDAAQHGSTGALDDARAEFYDRLHRAFAYLDNVVTDGRIVHYGVSSNSCVAPTDDPEATSVSQMVQASGGRMSVLQLPYNLFETGAVFERNTPTGTALAASVTHDLGVLVNRPLNAMAQPGGQRQRLIRLADPPRPGAPNSDEALRSRIEQLGQLEAALAAAAPDVVAPHVAEMVLGVWEDLAYPQTFQHLLRSEIIPEAQRGLRTLVSTLDRQQEPTMLAQIQAYQDDLNALIEPLQARATRQNPEIAHQIRQAIWPLLPPTLQDQTLSQLAMLFVVSTPGVSCALNGMRQPWYVEEAIGVMTLPPIPDVQDVAQALERAFSNR